MLLFCRKGEVRTQAAATTVCATGGVHTLTCCTHIFLRTARAQSHSHIFMRVHIHAWLKFKCLKRFVACACHTSPSRLHCLMSHPSLLSPYDESSSTFPSAQSSPTLPVLKAQDMRICARAPRSLATLPSPVSTQIHLSLTVLSRVTLPSRYVWSLHRHVSSALMLFCMVMSLHATHIIHRIHTVCMMLALTCIR